MRVTLEPAGDCEMIIQADRYATGIDYAQRAAHMEEYGRRMRRCSDMRRPLDHGHVVETLLLMSDEGLSGAIATLEKRIPIDEPDLTRWYTRMHDPGGSPIRAHTIAAAIKSREHMLKMARARCRHYAIRGAHATRYRQIQDAAFDAS
jgi:hypothetical protein